jgi:RHS repeat-associated protein
VFVQEIAYEKTVYGESIAPDLTEAQQSAINLLGNLRGRVLQHRDGAGVVKSYGIDPVTNTPQAYDFKGNLLRGSRQFAAAYKTTPDWLQAAPLEPEIFVSATSYDALDRVTSVTAPDKSVYRPAFNEANLLEKVDVNLRGALAGGQPAWTRFVTNIDYNAKGQRTLIQYANGADMTYEYDHETFRLRHMKTTRAAGQNGLPGTIFKNAGIVQDLHYACDPAGNITEIADAALQTVFNGQQIDPVCRYTYDASYRLIEASGREHIGQAALPFAPPDGNYRDYPFAGAATQNDLQALRNYTEQYDYDAVGNFKTMSHLTASGTGNWTRAYSYYETSLIELASNSNRLSQTALQTNAGSPAEPYLYDVHGNMVGMPHLALMRWDFRDQLSATSRQVVNAGTPETTFYVYDAGGQRVRKISERQNGTRKNQRLYLGGLEIYREFDAGGAVALERETLHVTDDKRRIALVETLTSDNGAAIAAPIPAQRYQLGNHLGSASLELDEAGRVISYEEYSPYGSTTYQAGRSAAEMSLKRYRYTGKERDEENGFTYHGARYYAPWLARWMSCDPASMIDGPNLYWFVRNNPIRMCDPSGMWPTMKDITDNIKTVDKVLGLVTGPLTGPLGAIAAAATTKAAEAVSGKSTTREGEKATTLSGPQRVEAGIDAFITATPAGPLHNTTKAIGGAIAGAVTGKVSKEEAGLQIAKQEPYGIVSKAADTAEALDRAEIAGHAHNRGGEVRAYIDAGVSSVELFQNILLVAVGGRLGGGKRGPTGGGGPGGGASPTKYTVLAETVLEGKTSRGSRGSHYNEAEAGLKQQVNAQKEIYKSPYRVNAVQDIQSVEEPLRKDGTGSVSVTAWHHHPFKEGLMQLVYRAEHQSQSLKHLFHPGGSGGFSRWLKNF